MAPGPSVPVSGVTCQAPVALAEWYCTDQPSTLTAAVARLDEVGGVHRAGVASTAVDLVDDDARGRGRGARRRATQQHRGRERQAGEGHGDTPLRGQSKQTGAHIDPPEIVWVRRPGTLSLLARATCQRLGTISSR